MASAPCVFGGVATVTATAPVFAIAASRSVNACGTPCACARRAVRSASLPTSPTTANPAARSAGTWMRQPNPVPTTSAGGPWAMADRRSARESPELRGVGAHDLAPLVGGHVGEQLVDRLARVGPVVPVVREVRRPGHVLDPDL